MGPVPLQLDKLNSRAESSCTKYKTVLSWRGLSYGSCACLLYLPIAPFFWMCEVIRLKEMPASIRRFYTIMASSVTGQSCSAQSLFCARRGNVNKSKRLILLFGRPRHQPWTTKSPRLCRRRFWSTVMPPPQARSAATTGGKVYGEYSAIRKAPTSESFVRS
jgi:hypothetical protein